jgi:hypothetical protein
MLWSNKDVSLYNIIEVRKMAAFERIKSGIPSMDTLLDNIRLGDNVVIQVSDLNDYRMIAGLFAKNCISEGKKVNYIRFASHDEILREQDNINIFLLDPNEGFENFTMQTRKIIEEKGCEAIFVFDCLSDLQTIWSTDQMMGNFFCVTCPYLFELDTVAFFPILRGHHDYSTIARIQDTTQLLLDVYSAEDDFYLHPIKVWNRYSPDMFLPHKLSKDMVFLPLMDSIDLHEYYNLLHEEQKQAPLLNMDSYERFFIRMKQKYKESTISQDEIIRIIRSMMTHDFNIEKLIVNHFNPEDLFFIRERMIGTGNIGGKACGMLLARKIVMNSIPGASDFLEPHDSFYIGTDVFYSFLVENKLWTLHILQQKDEYYFTKADELRELIMKGRFSENIRAQWRRMLEYFGQIPIIVRSSSFLEDGFANAFAGKYDSIFCASNTEPNERLERFENAVKSVYASMLNKSALEYRKKRQIDKTDEQMAILVQRVSGTRFGNYYLPCVAGIGFSYSLYRWAAELDPDAGMIRIVAGLGTKAVDRTGYDYPRLANLDQPEKTTLTTDEEKHRYSQRYVDMIDMRENQFTEIEIDELINSLPKWYIDLICEHDNHAESTLKEAGVYKNILYISCHKVVSNKKLMNTLSRILKVLNNQYNTSVDIEFTINFSPEGYFLINLLQCRPLYIWRNNISGHIPQYKEDELLIKSHDTFMGNTSCINVDYIIYVDSEKYHALSYKMKSSVASAIGKINKHFKDSNKNILLLTPGRIGTSSNEFGLTVNFAEISNFRVICEYSDKRIGFAPEFSFGSHMFQDLVENEFFYIAIDESNNSLLNKSLLSSLNDVSKDFPKNQEDYGCIKVFTSNSGYSIQLNADFENRLCVLLIR